MKSFNFVQACKGIMYLFIGIGIAAFGIASITNNSVKADHITQTNATGKIMMHESGFVLNGKAVYHTLVWDTETGKSKLYVFNGAEKMITPPYQLPSSPLY